MSKTQKGAAIGSVIGAGIGYAIKGDWEHAVGGAVVGGLTGTMIGRYMDNQEAALRKTFAASEAASIQRENDILAVTFKSDYFFDFDSAILNPGAYDEINRTFLALNEYPQTTIMIEGHTDNVGTEEYNLKLSKNRAEAVKDALLARGIDPARLQTVGFGESKPIADNTTEKGRQMNRRVKVVITPIVSGG